MIPEEIYLQLPPKNIRKRKHFWSFDMLCFVMLVMVFLERTSSKKRTKWQDGRGCAKAANGLRRKVWIQTKILIPNIREPFKNYLGIFSSKGVPPPHPLNGKSFCQKKNIVERGGTTPPHSGLNQGVRREAVLLQFSDFTKDPMHDFSRLFCCTFFL